MDSSSVSDAAIAGTELANAISEIWFQVQSREVAMMRYEQGDPAGHILSIRGFLHHVGGVGCSTIVLVLAQR
jgi:hypothetical protein